MVGNQATVLYELVSSGCYIDFTRIDTAVPPIIISPAAHKPAAKTCSKDVMQKKLIDCPISNQDPTNISIIDL